MGPLRRVLVARLDSMGDVLLAGPAVRAISALGAEVTMLVSSRAVSAAELLPGVDRTMVFYAPWVLADAPPVRRWGILSATVRMAAGRFDEALILTSHHQSPLPLALMLRLSGVRRISATSEDYPGSLLDVRVHLDDHLHEAQRSAELARAAGYPPQGSHLAVRDDLPEVDSRVGNQPYLVVHPGTDAGARRWPPAPCVGDPAPRGCTHQVSFVADVPVEGMCASAAEVYAGQWWRQGTGQLSGGGADGESANRGGLASADPR